MKPKAMILTFTPGQNQWYLPAVPRVSLPMGGVNPRTPVDPLVAGLSFTQTTPKSYIPEPRTALIAVPTGQQLGAPRLPQNRSSALDFYVSARSPQRDVLRYTPGEIYRSTNMVIHGK
ncbi:MAG: hypothetical protein Ct9H300mP11_25160 [Chloroflexota bacterium]|nr:MAG: hypothetical protein Ct9H300mP11_25160 [Chloroflexota bacterium]